MGGAAKVVTAPVKAVGNIVGSVAKPIAKAVGVTKDKPKVSAPEPAKPTIKGRDTAAERAAARKRARAAGGGLLSGASVIGSNASGGLPDLGKTDLEIKKSILSIPPEI